MDDYDYDSYYNQWPYNDNYDRDDIIKDLTLSKIDINETSFIPSFIDESSFKQINISQTILLVNNCIAIIEMFLYALKVALMKQGNINNFDDINFSIFHIIQYYNITPFSKCTKERMHTNFLSYFLDGAGPVITDEKEDINSLNQNNFTVKISSNLTRLYHPGTIFYDVGYPDSIKYLVTKYGQVLARTCILEKDIDYEKNSCYTDVRPTIPASVSCVIIGWDDNYDNSNFKVTPTFYDSGAYLAKVFGIKNVTYLWISYSAYLVYSYSFGDIDKSLFVDDSIKTYAYDNSSLPIQLTKFFEKFYLSEENGIEIPIIEGNTKNVFNTTYINNEYLIAVKYFLGWFVNYQLILEQNNESTILYEGYSDLQAYYTFTLKEPIKLITNRFSLKVAVKGNRHFYNLCVERREINDNIEPNKSFINNYDISLGKLYILANDKSWSIIPNDGIYENNISGMEWNYGACPIRAITKLGRIKQNK